MELKQGKLLKFNKPKTFFETSDGENFISIYAIKGYSVLGKNLIISIHEHTQQGFNIKDVDHDRLVRWLKSWGVDSHKKVLKRKSK